MFILFTFVCTKQIKLVRLRSHSTATSTRAETLSGVDWLSYLEVRNVAKILKQRRSVVRMIINKNDNK